MGSGGRRRVTHLLVQPVARAAVVGEQLRGRVDVAHLDRNVRPTDVLPGKHLVAQRQPNLRDGVGVGRRELEVRRRHVVRCHASVGRYRGTAHDATRSATDER